MYIVAFLIQQNVFYQCAVWYFLRNLRWSRFIVSSVFQSAALSAEEQAENKKCCWIGIQMNICSFKLASVSSS